MKTIKRFLAFVILIAMALTTFSGAAFIVASAAETNYYVCFENQNYIIRNANKMTLTESGEYKLANVTLNSYVGFYVTDGSGIKYCAKTGNDLYVDSSDSIRYDIKFNPTAKYETEKDGYKKTDCYVTYALYNPGNVTIKINETETETTYNAYRLNYDEYYISSVKLSEGDTVSFGNEVHTITADGYYRITYTAGNTVNGNLFLYDENGNYGTGDDFKYNIAVYDEPRYFITYPDKKPVGLSGETVNINGEIGYLIERYEPNVAIREYRTEAFFINEADYALKYAVYEETANGTYSLLDDDNDSDTEVEKLRFNDAGWYYISFLPSDTRYAVSTVSKSVKCDYYFIAGNFNEWGFDESGRINVEDAFILTKVEENDKYYEEDYEQYIIELYVTAEDLKNESPEFYITDGETKYRNLTRNITLDTKGRYTILFSDEHLYGNGRNYRYFFSEEEKDTEEICISSPEEWNSFAKRCNEEAGYSDNKAVYIVSDIDFEKTALVPIEIFSGTLYGGYHSLKNISVTNGNGINSVIGTLSKVGRIERLSVLNLSVLAKDDDYAGFVGKNFGTIKGVTVSGRIVGGRYVGGIAAYNGRTADVGVSASGYIKAVIRDCVNLADIQGNVNTGGIAGFNYGSLENCVNKGNITGKGKNSNETAIAAGGICGYSAGRVSECENKGNVSGDGNLLYAGGISGISTGETYFSFNRGGISATKYAGGAVGYYGRIGENNNDLSSYFGGIDYQKFLDYFTSDEVPDIDEAQGIANVISYAYNDGEVTAKSYAGGILAYANAAVPVNNCISTGNISVTAGDYVGGICGYTALATVSGCLSSGNITASGMNGNYVGGICGYGYEINYSVSSAVIEGNDYLGGIAGYLADGAKSNYTNVVIISNDNAANVGGLFGSVNAYRVAENDFNGKISSNYYVSGEVNGGLGGKDYGKNYDFAATKITSAELAFKDVLSPYLDGKFNAERYLASEDEKSYPVPYYLVNAEVSSLYGNDEDFIKIFDKYSEEFSSAAFKYCGVTYTYTFLEWNKDKGDLYDDGEIVYGNFDVIAVVRLYKGETLNAPEFVYAEKVGDRFVYKTDKGWYFASFDMNKVASDKNTSVYAEYKKATSSISTKDGKVLVEGLFDERTEVKTETTAAGIKLVFTLDGNEITVGNVRVKYLTYEGEYEVSFFDNGSLKKQASEKSGNYISFDYTDGEYFIVSEIETGALPVWSYVVFGAAGAFVVAGLIWLIVSLANRKKRVKKSRAKHKARKK